MRWSFPVARIAGIAVRIHATFLLLLAFYGFLFFNKGGTPAAVAGIGMVLVVFLCVLLHEFGHAFAARHYGIPTRDITLLPIGGVARLERMPEEPAQEIVVALAGPAVNLAIVLGLSVGTGLQAAFQMPSTDDAGDLGFLGEIMRVNKFLLLFNLIPAFPMDGGRVLRALLATRMGYARATGIAANVGQVIAIGFGLAGLGVLGRLGIHGFGQNPMLVFIAFFIFMAGSQEATAVRMKELTRDVRLQEALITDFKALPVNATLGDAVELLLHGSQQDFPVVDDTGRAVGVLTRADLITALGKGGPGTPAATVMRRDVPAVSVHAPFETAFREMQAANCPALPVVDRAGRLVGLITPENVGELMMVHSVLGRGARPAWRTA